MAKIRRVAFGIKLNPNGGCAIVIPTGAADGPCGPGPEGTGEPPEVTVTLTVILLQFTVPRLHVSGPLPAEFKLVTRPPFAPELTVKLVDPPLDQVTAFVQSVTLESE